MDLQSVSASLHQLADRRAQDQGTLLRGEEEFALDIWRNFVLELKDEEENAKPLLSVNYNAKN